MINLHSIVMVITAVAIWVGGFYLLLSTDARTPEPKLYCHYETEQGVAVYDYEDIRDGYIITKAGDVFDMSVCIAWKDR